MSVSHSAEEGDWMGKAGGALGGLREMMFS